MNEELSSSSNKIVWDVLTQEIEQHQPTNTNDLLHAPSIDPSTSITEEVEEAGPSKEQALFSYSFFSSPPFTENDTEQSYSPSDQLINTNPQKRKQHESFFSNTTEIDNEVVNLDSPPFTDTSSLFSKVPSIKRPKFSGSPLKESSLITSNFFAPHDSSQTNPLSSIHNIHKALLEEPLDEDEQRGSKNEFYTSVASQPPFSQAFPPSSFFSIASSSQDEDPLLPKPNLSPNATNLPITSNPSNPPSFFSSNMESHGDLVLSPPPPLLPSPNITTISSSSESKPFIDLDLNSPSAPSPSVLSAPPTLRKIDYTLLPDPQQAYVEATQENGTRLFLPFRVPQVPEVLPFHMDTIYALLHDLRIQKNESVNPSTISTGSSTDSYEDMDTSSENHIRSSSVSATPSQLWIDRFRPRRYLDLVTDETVSREILSWIKSWDPIVFPSMSFSSTSLLKFTKPDPVPSKKNSMNSNVLNMKPVLLLAGPPGVGKSTLIHVLAQQAGYSVLDLNVNDEKTTLPVFQSRFTAALESHTLNQGLSKLPSLVVLEDLDGVPAHEQNWLTWMVQRLSASSTSSASATSSSSFPKRPVICTCHDPYLPFLKSLRAIAQLVWMRPPSHVLPIVQRLQQICHEVNIPCPVRSLYHLVETSNGDLRACLNQLQFYHGIQLPSSFKLVDKLEKDSTYSWMQASSMLFTDPTLTFSQLWSVLDQQDADRFAMTCFESYLTPHISSLDSIPQVLESLFMYTKVTHPEVCFLPFFFHFRPTSSFARARSGKLQPFPKQDYEFTQKYQRHRSILQSFYSGFESILKTFWHPFRHVVVDLLPLLPALLSVPSNSSLLPLSSSLADQQNKKDRIQRVVNLLGLWHLSLVSQMEDRIRNIRIEPPIEQLCLWQNSQSIPKRPFFTTNISLKQRILSQLEEMRIRYRTDPKKVSKPKKPLETDPTSRDFFGRPISVSDSTSSSSSNSTDLPPASSSTPTIRIRLKFNEGYSNAVRKPMHVRDLL